MREISPLHRQMIDDMTVRNLSPATQRSFCTVTKFSRYFGRSRPSWTGRRARVSRASGVIDDYIAGEIQLDELVSKLGCVPTIQQITRKKASDPSNVTETCLYEMACGSEAGEPPNRRYCA
ncbi:hypothetical protein ACVI3U_003917 [Sinorhizobium medicae]